MSSDALAALVETLKRYQELSYAHPLTCRAGGRHGRLEPEIGDGIVVLCCPDCDYTQPVELEGEIARVVRDAVRMPAPIAPVGD